MYPEFGLKLCILVIKNDIVSSNVSWNSSSGGYKLYLLIIDSVILVNAGFKTELNISSLSDSVSQVRYFMKASSSFSYQYPFLSLHDEA